MSETTTTIEQIREEIATLEQALKDAKARAKALRVSTTKTKAEPKECGCGCGDLTRGGDFLPGHDARFRGQMLRLIDGGDESAIAKLLARPTLLHGATEADLRERLGSEKKKKEAQVARIAERAKAAKSAKAQRVDKAEAQQGTMSPSVKRNAGAIRLAKQRAAA